MLLTPQHHPALLDAARDVIRRTLAGQPAAPPPDTVINPALLEPAGCFVTLHELGPQHALRGCVGRLDATRPLIEAVRYAAASVLEDPRFDDRRITLDELPNLEIEISVLSPLRPADHPLAFDPQDEGIYLSIGGRSGCFLPQVARETGWSREQLLSRLCSEKMRMPPTAWKLPQAKLQVFKTVTVGPVAFEEG